LHCFIQQSNHGNFEERQQLLGQLNDLCRTASAPQPITVTEVTEAIRSNKDGSPGPDCIKVDDYKHLSDKTIAELTDLYNNSLYCGKVPEVWTDAFIGPVPKPAKDHKCLKGHRIIVVQNVIGKIPEKIAPRRFTRHIQCVLPPDMGAYGPHRETWINPATVAANIWDGFKEKDNTLLVALDLEDDYNCVRLPILADRILQLSICLLGPVGHVCTQHQKMHDEASDMAL